MEENPSSDESTDDCGTDGPNVFLSYARQDKDIARLIVEQLTERGINVWWDCLLRPGDKTALIIYEQLQRADVVVVLWSACSVSSEWVWNEAEFGREQEKLLSVCTHELEHSRLPFPFRGRHVEVFDKFDVLAEAVRNTNLEKDDKDSKNPKSRLEAIKRLEPHPIDKETLSIQFDQELKNLKSKENAFRKLRTDLKSLSSGNIDIKSAKVLLDVSSAIETEMELTDAETESRVLCMDTNVLYHYCLFDGDYKSTLSEACAFYLCDESSMHPWTITSAHGFEVKDLINKLINRSLTAINQGNMKDQVALERIFGALKKNNFLPWKTSISYTPNNLHQLIEISHIRSSVGNMMPRRGYSRSSYERDVDALSNIIFNNRYVSKNRDYGKLLSLVTMSTIFQSLSNNFYELESGLSFNQTIRSPYGPAWRKFTSEPAKGFPSYFYKSDEWKIVGLSQELRKIIESVEFKNIREEDFWSSSTVQKSLFGLARLIEPFHSHLANRAVLEMKRRQDLFKKWTEKLHSDIRVVQEALLQMELRFAEMRFSKNYSSEFSSKSMPEEIDPN